MHASQRQLGVSRPDHRTLGAGVRRLHLKAAARVRFAACAYRSACGQAAVTFVVGLPARGALPAVRPARKSGFREPDCELRGCVCAFGRARYSSFRRLRRVLRDSHAARVGSRH
uniref:Uncharacterized protein n=1 Tax=Romanomermis culicivorax TaxID=13658 RepID=A0A915LCY2_ROMCU